MFHSKDGTATRTNTIRRTAPSARVAPVEGADADDDDDAEEPKLRRVERAGRAVRPSQVLLEEIDREHSYYTSAWHSRGPSTKPETTFNVAMTRVCTRLSGIRLSTERIRENS
jgi:hypothetical protein